MTLADWFSERLDLTTRQLRAAIRAMQAVMALVALAGVVLGRLGLVSTGLVPLLVTLAPAYLRRDLSAPLDVGWTLWLTTAALIHVVGSVWAYDRFGWYDQVAHAVSGGLVAVTGYVLLRAVTLHAEGVHVDERFRSVFTVVVVLAVSVVWELLEYATELLARWLGGEAALVVRGPHDIALDLLFSGVGALLVAAWDAVPVQSVATVLAARLDEN